MKNWQEGQYNSDYILHHKSIVGQIKYECNREPARLEEISIERHDNGDICIVFTTHVDATNDSKQGGIHARLAYNTLFQEIQRLVHRTGLEYITTNLDEVHRLHGRKGQERLLIQALILLEEYDNTLAEISRQLQHYIAPERASLEDLSDEIILQEQRLNLLKQVLAGQASAKNTRNTQRSKFKEKAMTSKRKTRTRVATNSRRRRQA